MGRSVRLIVNPAAGRGLAGAQEPGVVEVLTRHGWSVEVRHAEAAEAEQLAAEVGPDVLVCSLGRNGTHARVASGAYVAGAAFSPLPGGRGNDLVRAVGLPRHAVAAAARLAQARERRIDLGDVAGAPFLGVVSIGTSVRANVMANRSQVSGAGAYHIAATKAVMRAEPAPYRLVLDGDVHEFAAYEIAIGLSCVYGGGLRVCPAARLDDGLLDVTVVRGPRRHFTRILLAMFEGRHEGIPGVEMFQARTERVEGEGPVFADGGLVGPLPITATLSPRALRLLA